MAKSKYVWLATILIVIIGFVFLISQIAKLGKSSLKETFQNPQVIIFRSPTAQPTVSETKAGLFLSITSPADGAKVANATLAVIGKTAALADVFVNDFSVKADQKGNFSVELTLETGENIISVLANDTEGNYAEKEIGVTLEQE